MKTALIAFLVLLASPAMAGEDCDDKGSIDCCASGGPVSEDLCLGDDVKLGLGNDCDAPDCSWEWDTAGTHRLLLYCNDVGAGSPGVVGYLNTGTDDWVWSGGATFGDSIATKAGTAGSASIWIGPAANVDGFFSYANNYIAITFDGGSMPWIIGVDYFGSSGSAAGAFLTGVSAISPGVVSSNSDNDNGLCYPGTDQQSICVGGVQGITAAEASDSLSAKFVSGLGQASLIEENTKVLAFAGDPGDASQTTSSLCPAVVTIVGITTRTTTAATNCSSVDIGIAGDTDMFGDDTGITQGTTTDSSDYTAYTQMGFQSAAFEVVVTANGGNCFDGVWKVTCHYLNVSAATDNN